MLNRLKTSRAKFQVQSRHWAVKGRQETNIFNEYSINRELSCCQNTLKLDPATLLVPWVNAHLYSDLHFDFSGFPSI